MLTRCDANDFFLYMYYILKYDDDDDDGEWFKVECEPNFFLLESLVRVYVNVEHELVKGFIYLVLII